MSSGRHRPTSVIACHVVWSELFFLLLPRGGRGLSPAYLGVPRAWHRENERKGSRAWGSPEEPGHGEKVSPPAGGKPQLALGDGGAHSPLGEQHPRRVSIASDYSLTPVFCTRL